jgi:4-amino-4-deoxy-L-arabinose transferase-like glycosyltransferase
MRTIWLILALFLALSFLTLPRIALQNDDASGYALSVRNTIVFNEWFAPLLSQGDPTGLFDKPPLGIWLLAWFPKLAGLNEITIHVPNVIYFCILLAVFYFFLARYTNKDAALISTMIAATGLCLTVYSRAPKLEVPLALCLTLAHFSLYSYLASGKARYAYGVAAAAAAGFLIKSGLGLLPLVLTTLALLIFLPATREKIWRLVFSRHGLFSFLLFLGITGGVIGAQYLALKDAWTYYLGIITLKSPYNPGYLGLGFHPSILGFLLIAIFPWTPLFLGNLKIKKDFSPATFAALWLWPNFIFLLFCYNFTDLRTFTAFVPPLAIIAGAKLNGLLANKERAGTGTIIWQLFFLFLFAAGLIVLLVRPVNQDGVPLAAALPALALFVAALAVQVFFLFRPSLPSLALCFALIVSAYAALYYDTGPLVNAFNPQVKWPALIREARAQGGTFIIYRPRDRARFMSPDLFYTDFMAGPADKYFWNGAELKTELKQNRRAIVLSDAESWKKLGLKLPVLAQDNYASLIKAF